MSEVVGGSIERLDAVVRIHGGAQSGVVVGAGMLIDRFHVLTCAHVIESATASTGYEDFIARSVTLDFPAVRDSLTTATLAPGEFHPIQADGEGDIAILRLDHPAPIAVTPIALLPNALVSGHACRVLGFPRDSSNGRWAVGVPRGAAGPGWAWLQFDEVGPGRIERGFSGTPVWDDELNQVIGMLVARDRSAAKGATFFIPVASLVEASPLIRQVVQRNEHEQRLRMWGSRVRGVESGTVAGDYFTGRRRILDHFHHWFAATLQHPRESLIVLTGSPGSGKSTVLARLMTVIDGYAIHESAAPDDAWRRFTVVAAVDLRGKNLPEAAIAVANASGYFLSVTSVGGKTPDQIARVAVENILGHVRRHEQQHCVLLFDSLDEAREPDDIIAEFILPLAQAWNPDTDFRIVVTARTSVRGDAADNTVVYGLEGHEHVNLDDEEFLQLEDLEVYSYRLLTHEGDPHSMSPYTADHSAARGLARVIARRSFPNFLVTQLLSLYYAELEQAVTESEAASLEGRLPASIGQALNLYLRRFGRDEQRVRDLLNPLAWAPDGEAALPADDLWLAIANEMSGEDYTYADLRWLLRTPAGNLLNEVTDKDGRAYRLYHAAFAAHLRQWQQDRERQTYVSVNQRILAGMMQYLTNISPKPGRIDWLGAPSYVKRHLSLHAAHADGLDPLLRDPLFVAVADLSRLLQSLEIARSDRSRQISELVRASAASLRYAPPVERLAYLKLGALTYDYPDINDAIDDLHVLLPWTPRWSTSRKMHPSLDVLVHEDSAGMVSIKVDGKTYVAVCDLQGRILVVEVLTGRPFRFFRYQGVTTNIAATNLEGRFLVVVLSDSGLLVLDAMTREFLAPAQALPFSVNKYSEQWLTAMAIDGELKIAYGNVMGTWAHDVRTGRYSELPKSRGYDFSVFSSATVEKYGGTVVLAGVREEDDSTLLGLWDFATGDEVIRPTSVAQEVDSSCHMVRGGVEFLILAGDAILVISMEAEAGVVGQLIFPPDQVPTVVCATDVLEYDFLTLTQAGHVRAWDSRSFVEGSADAQAPFLETDRYLIDVVTRPGLSYGNADHDPEPAFFAVSSSIFEYPARDANSARLGSMEGRGAKFFVFSLETGRYLGQHLDTNRGLTHALVLEDLSIVMAAYESGPLVWLAGDTGQATQFGDYNVADIAVLELHEETLLVVADRNNQELLEFSLRSFGEPLGDPRRVISLEKQPKRCVLVHAVPSAWLAIVFMEDQSVVELFEYPAMAHVFSIGLGEGVLCSTLNSTSHYLLCGTLDGSLMIFDLANRTLVRSVALNFMPTSAALLPPNILLVSGVGNLLRIDL